MAQLAKSRPPRRGTTAGRLGKIKPFSLLQKSPGYITTRGIFISVR